MTGRVRTPDRSRAAESWTRVVWAASLTLVLASCGTVDPAPFVAFEAATERLATGSAEMFELGAEWARKGYLTNAGVFDETGDLERLALVQDTDDSLEVDVRDATPYTAVVRAGKTSARLNRAFVAYADLLARMAGDEPVDDDAIDALAADLHEHLGEAATAAGFEVPERALLSAAAAASFRAYITHRRRSELVAALEAAQPSVEAWARLGVDATERLGNDLFIEYQTERRWRMDAYARTSVDSKRKTAANAVLKMTETMLDAFSALRALRRAYHKLPEAHADLVDAARGEDGLAALRAFASDMRRLRELRDELAEKAR